MTYKLFDDPYIYGPITEEELTLVVINHRLIKTDEGYYIGVSKEIDSLSDKAIIKPPYIVDVDT
jgi:adenylate kinase